MEIQYCSDLHLEFSKNRNWFKQNPLYPQSEILIIAGDTYYLNRKLEELDFIKRAADEFEKVYLIPGNHEYYGGYDISTALNPMHLEIFSNVFMVNNQVINIKGIDFIFSTMWSNITKNIVEVVHGIADFKMIKFKDEKFNINHFNLIHQEAFNFISNSMHSENKKVVVTHHLPSNHCNAKEFRGSVLNEAFCVEKTNFILNNEIDCWIYGHSHRNLIDFNIGKTKMLTNQFGYVNWNEHLSFDYSKTTKLS